MGKFSDGTAATSPVSKPSLSVYSLRQILSLGKQKSKSVYIEKSSTCRTEVFSLFALYCSNGYIILRYAGPSNDTRNVLPILRYIPWCVNTGTEGSNGGHSSTDNSGALKGRGYNHTVKALCFNDNGKQLFVLCKDGSVYCLPALEIVMETNPSVKVSRSDHKDMLRSTPTNELLQTYARSPESGESTSDNSSIRKARQAVKNAKRLVKKGRGVISITFWRSFKDKTHLLLGTEQGRMIIVDCGQEKFGEYVLGLFVAPKHCIDNINVLTDGSKQRRWRYAIIHIRKNENKHNNADASSDTKVTRETYRILLERPKAFVEGMMSPYKDAKGMKKNDYVNLLDHLSPSDSENPFTNEKSNGLGVFETVGTDSENSNGDLQLHPDFLPQKMTFAHDYEFDNKGLSEQHLGSWQGSGLGLYNEDQLVFSLFSVDAPLPQRYPLFEFLMPSSTQNILYTKRIIFVDCQGETNEDGTRKSIVKLYSSFLLSGVSTTKSPTPGGKEHFLESGNAGLIQTFELPSGSDSSIIKFSYAPWCFTKSDDLYLEGVIMITRDAIYEFQPRGVDQIEANFQSLIDYEDNSLKQFEDVALGESEGETKPIQSDKTTPEQYAQVLGLNILALYEQAGNRKLREGKQHGERALSLFKLSGMNVHQILKRLILASRPDLAAMHASFVLSSNNSDCSKELSRSERVELSHLAVKCYLSCVEQFPPDKYDPREQKSRAADEKSTNSDARNGVLELQLCSEEAKIVEPNAPPGLLSFLEKNNDYDTKYVLKLLCQTGLYGAVFVAAHSRKKITIALNLFSQSSAPKLNRLCYQYLLVHNYTKEICLTSNSSIFHCLDANAQFHLMFGNVSHEPLSDEIYLIVHLYPVISTRMHNWSKKQILDASIVIENMLKSLNDAYMSSRNEADNANRCKSLCILSECLVHFLLTYISDTASHMTRKVSSDTAINAGEERERQLQRLETFVSLETKYFRQNTIECLAVDFRCFGVAALMYESSQRYDKAINLRLLEIQSAHMKKDGKASECLIRLIETHVLKIPNTNRSMRVNALRKIFSAWLKLRLDVKILETMILKHISSLGYEFATILFSRHNTLESGSTKRFTAKDSIEPLYCHFSKDVCFALCIDQMSPSQQHRNRRRASSAGLFAGICANLSKGIDDNRKIVLHGEDIIQIREKVMELRGTDGGIGMGSIVIFSCGHVFPKAEFFEVVLEEFKERLLKLKYTLPATLAVLLKEYHKDKISCACPRCLLTYFEDADMQKDLDDGFY